jgi:tRNA uridine 5-carboxymethylaminomethyl modification enzyme
MNPIECLPAGAEFRTLLRQDNADLRLTEKGFNLGLASEERVTAVNDKKLQIRQIIDLLDETRFEPGEINNYLEENNSSPIPRRTRASQILLRPGINLENMIEAIPSLSNAIGVFSSEALEQAEIQTKYQVYLDKEEEMVKKMGTLENQIIPHNFDYDKIASLSNESRQKFNKIRPQTLGQASRISGVNPSDVQILMVYMGR